MKCDVKLETFPFIGLLLINQIYPENSYFITIIKMVNYPKTSTKPWYIQHIPSSVYDCSSLTKSELSPLWIPMWTYQPYGKYPWWHSLFWYTCITQHRRFWGRRILWRRKNKHNHWRITRKNSPISLSQLYITNNELRSYDWSS